MANPLNYTTQVDAAKTAGECVALLASHKASAVGIEYDEGQPTGVYFKIGTPHGPRQYTLPVNPAGTYRALVAAKVAPRYQNREQAQRVAWRVAKDWLEAQLALVQAGNAELAQVMLPYMQVAPGITTWDAYVEGQLAIESGEGGRG